MTPTWRKRLPAVLGALGIIAAMTTLVCYAPTLYRLFCSATGAGGTTRRASADKVAAQSAGGPTITVTFDANVAPALGWDFHAVQKSVVVRPGVPTKIYYEATNDTSETLVGHATYNVAPYKIAPYFFKIQCFCFTDERLGPHETARMPVVFYIDEQMMKDAEARGVRQVTLSYTFFKQDKLSPEDVAAARDLKAGSATLDQSLNTKKAVFDNDAPKRND